MYKGFISLQPYCLIGLKSAKVTITKMLTRLEALGLKTVAVWSWTRELRWVDQMAEAVSNTNGPASICCHPSVEPMEAVSYCQLKESLQLSHLHPKTLLLPETEKSSKTSVFVSSLIGASYNFCQ